MYSCPQSHVNTVFMPQIISAPAYRQPFDDRSTYVQQTNVRRLDLKKVKYSDMPRGKSLHLSKSKFISGIQCLKKLYFSVHEPELGTKASKSTQFLFEQGHEVGKIAQKQFPGGKLIDTKASDHAEAIKLTKEAMKSEVPAIFEAAFDYKEIRIRVDILQRVKGGYKLIEVKSGTSAKEVNLYDTAIQTFVLQGLGITLKGIYLMTINPKCVIPNYKNLFALHDVRSDVSKIIGNIPDWLSKQRQALNRPETPTPPIGKHCLVPFKCEFWNVCTKGAPKYPIWELRSFDWAKWNSKLEKKNWAIKDQVDKDLDPTQLKQKNSIAKKAAWVSQRLSTALKPFKSPIHYLDFETTSMVVFLPFKGYHPYDQIPFQFSALYVNSKGTEKVTSFLHTSTEDPLPTVAAALVGAFKEPGRIVVYNIGFESRMIKMMAKAVPNLRKDLLALVPRLIDIWPVVKNNIYHPDFHGSYSLKDVYPVLCNTKKGGDYSKLAISEGSAASVAFVESLKPDTTAKKRTQIQKDLIKYCAMDTKATYLVHKALVASCK